MYFWGTSPTHRGSAIKPRGVNGVFHALQISRFHVTVKAHAEQQRCARGRAHGGDGGGSTPVTPSYQTWPSFSSSSSLV